MVKGINATLNIQETIEELKSTCSDYALELLEYSGSTYICDAITEIADGNTSIYYSDIMEYIGNNTDAVNNAINEFGWDGCGEDIYKAGQMAEFLDIEQEIYNDLETAVQVYALDYIASNYKETVITCDMWQELQIELEDIDNNSRIEDINELVNNFVDTDYED